MMWVGDRKQGINKCWPNVKYVVHYLQVAQLTDNHVGICILLPSVQWYFDDTADDVDNSVLNGIGGLCDKVSVCYNYSMTHDVTSLVASQLKLYCRTSYY